MTVRILTKIRILTMRWSDIGTVIHALRNERPLGPTPRKTAATCTATITRENAQNPEPM